MHAYAQKFVCIWVCTFIGCISPCLSSGICWSMWFTYVLAEVTPCKQADIDFRGHEEIYSEPGGVMDYEEDRGGRPKR